MTETDTTDSINYQIPEFGDVKIVRARIIGYAIYNERESMYPSMVIPVTQAAWQVNALVCVDEDCYYRAVHIGVTHDPEFNPEEWIKKAERQLKRQRRDEDIETEMREEGFPQDK